MARSRFHLIAGVAAVGSVAGGVAWASIPVAGVITDEPGGHDQDARRRGDARAGAAWTARLAHEHAENRAEECMPPRRLCEGTPLRARGGRPGSPRAGW